MASDTSGDTGQKAWGFLKGNFNKAKAAAENAHFQHQQNRLRSAIEAARQFEDDEAIAEALGRIPDDWEQLDAAKLKPLLDDTHPG